VFCCEKVPTHQTGFESLSHTELGLARPMGLSLAKLGWPNGPAIPSS
jgi:hypothetical protein